MELTVQMSTSSPMLVVFSLFNSLSHAVSTPSGSTLAPKYSHITCLWLSEILWELGLRVHLRWLVCENLYGLVDVFNSIVKCQVQWTNTTITVHITAEIEIAMCIRKSCSVLHLGMAKEIMRFPIVMYYHDMTKEVTNPRPRLQIELCLLPSSSQKYSLTYLRVYGNQETNHWFCHLFIFVMHTKLCQA